MLVLAVGTTRAASAASATACYTARSYRILLAADAALLVATVYCLMYVREYGVLLLAIHIPDRLAAYLLWAFLTKCKKDVSIKVTFSPESRCNICVCHEW